MMKRKLITIIVCLVMVWTQAIYASGYDNIEEIIPEETQTDIELVESCDETPDEENENQFEKTEDDKQDEISNGYGIYCPDSFTAAGGTGKAGITCPAIKYSEEGFWGKIVFNSKAYTKLQVNGVMYPAAVNEAAGTSTFIIPIIPNVYNYITATTYEMNVSCDIQYAIKAVWSIESAKSDEVFLAGTVDSSGKDEQLEKSSTDMEDGTYRVMADTDNRMFYIPVDRNGQRYAILEKKENNLVVTMALTGTGYDYLYSGTTEEAEKADRSEYIGYIQDQGYYTYTFRIPELDKELQLAAHSKNRDMWYQHTVIFKSGNAIKVEEGTSAVPPTDNGDKKKPSDSKKPETDRKPSASDKQQTAAAGKTSAIDSSTGLKDGVYKLDKFSWAGGTGRLAYIRCTRLTVKEGKAYATIEFGSSGYDKLKANGRIYGKGSGSLSTFTIPVKLNANNTIIGRSVAMSQPHWITYTIYPYMEAAGETVKGGSHLSQRGAAVDRNRLSDEAPGIPGLEFVSETETDYAENFKIYNYEKGITLIQISMAENSALNYKEKDNDEAGKIEYDDDGKPIAKTQAEIVEEIYKSNVINYLVVPEKVEIPAGLDKEMIIIRSPADRTYTASKMAVKFIEELDITKNIELQGHYRKTEYKDIIRSKINLAIFSGMIVPEKVDIKAKNDKKLAGAEKKRIKEQKAELEKTEKRFATLGIPFLVDRSCAEKTKAGKAEWIKVYGAIYGCQKEADEIYKKVKETIEKENGVNEK